MQNNCGGAIIRVYNKITDMSGYGEEWLMDSQGNVMLKLIDGNIPVFMFQVIDNSETTKIIA